MAKTCPNSWPTKVFDPKTRTAKATKKPCGFDLTEARKIRGEELVRCPQCGRKL